MGVISEVTVDKVVNITGPTLTNKNNWGQFTSWLKRIIKKNRSVSKIFSRKNVKKLPNEPQFISKEVKKIDSTDCSWAQFLTGCFD